MKRTILFSILACAALPTIAQAKPDPLDLSCDVVVVGAGSGGMSAALSAAQHGKHVIVLEKEPFPGGASNYAEGIFAVETEQQRRSAIDLTKDQAFTESMHFNHYKGDAPLIREFIDQANVTVDWLEHQGVSFDVVRISPTEAPSWHLVKPWKDKVHGAALVSPLVEKARAAGVKILYQTAAKALLRQGSVVTGVQGVDVWGRTVTVRAKSTVLATGGFTDSAEQVSKRTGLDGKKIFPAIPLHKVGEGIDLAVSAGGVTKGQGMMMCPGSAGVGIRPLGALFTMSWQPLLWVNVDGERFTNEDVAQSFALAGNAIYEQKGSTGFVIWDQDTADAVRTRGIDNGIGVLVPIGAKVDTALEAAAARAAGSKDVAMADTLEELAGQLGLDPKKLRATVDAYNGFGAKGHDDGFAKNPRMLTPVKRGKFYATRLNPFAFISIGGARVNRHMEAIDKDGKAIAGLYVVGADVGGLYGDTYTLWTSGAMFGWACTSGRLAGQYSAEYASK